MNQTQSQSSNNNKRVLIITSAIQEQTVARINTNKPQLRHSNIITKRPQFVQILYVQQKLTTQILKQLHVHDSGLIDYLQNCYLSYQQKPDYSYNYLQAGIVPYTFIQDTFKHHLLQKLDYWKQAGIWGKDAMTPIFKNTWKTIIQSANNCYIVPHMININNTNQNNNNNKQKQINNNYDVIYCLNMYPGHHASKNKYGGYCFLNNGAICAKSLQMNGYRNIAILDLDYHAGDGTQNIFNNDDTVITVSIHADPLLDYPFYSNFQSESKTNKNIIFSPNTDGAKYLQHVSDALNFINKYQYDALIVAFGGDTYYLDPDASQYCRCGLKYDDYKQIGQLIRENVKNINNNKMNREIPIIVTQQGGYNMDDIHEVVYSFLDGLSNSK